MKKKERKLWETFVVLFLEGTCCNQKLYACLEKHVGGEALRQCHPLGQDRNMLTTTGTMNVKNLDASLTFPVVLPAG